MGLGIGRIGSSFIYSHKKEDTERGSGFLFSRSNTDEINVQDFPCIISTDLFTLPRSLAHNILYPFSNVPFPPSNDDKNPHRPSHSPHTSCVYIHHSTKIPKVNTTPLPHEKPISTLPHTPTLSLSLALPLAFFLSILSTLPLIDPNPLSPAHSPLLIQSPTNHPIPIATDVRPAMSIKRNAHGVRKRPFGFEIVR